MHRALPSVVLLALFSFPATALDVAVTTEPAVPLIETTRAGQALNFDVLIGNSTREPLELLEFELSVRDPRGALVMRRRVGQNGNTIEVIPSREISAGAQLLVFNPLVHWPADVSVENLELALTLAGADGNEQVIKQKILARPYPGKHPLRMPLDGAVFVHAGHDFLAHHRRFPLHSAMTEALKIRHNVTRYAYDFAPVDDRGEMHRGAGLQLSDWFGYGAPVRAPAAGTVVEVHDGLADNEFGKPPRLDRDALLKNPRLLFGNYVLIDHGEGEFSLLAHLKQGTVTVKTGGRVQSGQVVAAVGMSGDAAIPHLHLQMQAAPGFAEGIPSRFADFSRKLGQHWSHVNAGPVESGEIVRNGK
jgi:murein DD-endopeptidase MepM/ murein hydrolase activator NlpD